MEKGQSNMDIVLWYTNSGIGPPPPPLLETYTIFEMRSFYPAMLIEIKFVIV